MFAIEKAFANALYFIFIHLFFSLPTRSSSQNSTHNFPSSVFRIELSHNIPIESQRELSEGPPAAPLYPGKGIHYAFLWVGSPPQRVSVIMDTGSHHTAFPCVGCKCGVHMDPYFDPQRSGSASVKSCGPALGSNKCFFRQSYSEGSSWHAFKVSDKVYIGGEKLSDLPQASNFSLSFEFGCQDYETGLFRTQHVDGIMGLSASEETLPFQLHAQRLLSSRLFGLCFRHGGGVLTLGGVEESLFLHTPRSSNHINHHAHGSASTTGGGGKSPQVLSPIVYAKLLKPKGWFTVSLLDILLRVPGGEAKSIGGPLFSAIGGKGTIIDSGTTDTYLPAALAGGFKKAFKELTGLGYENKPMKIERAALSSLPSVLYRLEGTAGEAVDIEVPPSSYMELHSGESYTPRIYLTEAGGAVLGANFINYYYTLFDIDNMRIGFAKSDCK